MSFFKTIKDKKNTTSVPSALDSIDEILNVSNDFSKVNNNIKDELKSLTESNLAMRKNLQKQKDFMNDEHVNKHSTSNSFVDNFQEETGHDLNKPQDEPSSETLNTEFGSTENDKNKGKSKDLKFKRSEIPLLSRKVVKGIGDRLKESVFGQNQVIEEIEDGLVVNSVNLNINEEKPVGCYLFAGPSGVGKTELCLQIAKQLDVPILVINMGEHALEQDVTKLIGVAAGYVGYGTGGILTNFVGENPRCVIVFDELEKAHVSINKILLSIMDKGVCRDNKNREVFFDQTLFIATTNLGAAIEYETHLSEEEKFDYRMQIIKQHLAPEIINRYDSIFQFKALNHEIYGRIVRKFTKQLSDTSKKRNNFEINTTDELINFITKHSYDPSMGGRPARRFIEKIILKPLAYELLDEEIEKRIHEAGAITLDVQDEKIVFKINDEIVSTLDKTMELVEQFNKGKFSTKVEEEEIAPEHIPETSLIPELQTETENKSKGKSRSKKVVKPE